MHQAPSSDLNSGAAPYTVPPTTMRGLLLMAMFCAVDVLIFVLGRQLLRRYRSASSCCVISSFSRCTSNKTQAPSHLLTVKPPLLAGDDPLPVQEDQWAPVMQQAHADTCEQVTSPRSFDSKLQDQINVVVSTHAGCQKQSPAPCSSVSELQAQINSIVAGHGKSLSQQRLAVDPSEMASPSPAKSFSDMELAYYANLVLSNAKQRRTPAKSPAPSPSYAHWAAYEHGSASCQSNCGDGEGVADARQEGALAACFVEHHYAGSTAEPTSAVYEHSIAPCHLNFSDGEGVLDPQQDALAASLCDSSPAAFSAEPTGTASEDGIAACIGGEVALDARQGASSVHPIGSNPDAFADVTHEKSADAQKIYVPQLNLNKIPSPARNRAKRQQSLQAAMAQGDAKRASCSALEDVHQTPVKEYSTTKAPQQESLSRAMQYSQNKAEEEAEQPEDDEEAARLKVIEEGAALLRKMKEKAEIAAMDRLCVETFLESVKRCAWHKRVYTPIKGTNLYTKHMRPCRPVGTSVDVRDSSFGSLGFFLQFLEAEGLLSLEPGLTDPVVAKINFTACRNYQYKPRSQPQATLPQEAGCSFQKFQECTASVPTTTQWQ
eukprot:gnl/TRDRNA2_/TRDRNA2_85932_c1_seq1.p1 gnl/TRDRNA2_/TRDRNA2_85932_c1~~gnl/TRDRNA2_/TRDRNA2_85932_c1_seq1.p1  ORF type:complete len:604 (-),score=81.74 gnl/TRDRNA2_/TRDRNA2_85932_c1_seq1:326-2137(-)